MDRGLGLVVQNSDHKIEKLKTEILNRIEEKHDG